MAGTGKLLEVFVAQIEKILLPQGIAVTPNEKVYDDEGVQIAEFDIEIDGKIGSTRLKWLIECRDRPSQGPTPGSWIEQLVGRRERFSFNKVIAVSTTGFAAGAKEYADRAGIEVRTVTEADVNQIKDWFLVDKMPLFRKHGRLDHARLLVSNAESDEIKNALLKKLKAIPANQPNQPILEPVGQEERITLIAAFQSAVNSVEGLYDELMPRGGAKKIKLRVAYPQDDGHFVTDTELGKVRITEILFQGELSVEKEEIPIAAIRKYENVSQEEDIATTASFDLEVDGRPMECSFHRIANTGETHILLRAPKQGA